MSEPISMQQLTDASVDVNSLEVVVNGDENTDVETRLGATYPSIQKSMRLMTEMGIGFTPFETKALMTASAKTDGTYAVVTNDVIANIGVYLKKSGAWGLVPWNNFINLNALKINAGKDYPLVQRRRNNVTSNAFQPMNDALLNVNINYGDPNYYYRVAYYANGNTTYTADGSGWMIEKILKSGFESANNASIQIVRLQQAQARIERNKGIQQIELITATGMSYQEQIYVTVDSDNLPPSGSAISVTSASANGYSFVVDESCTKTGVNYDKYEYPSIRYSDATYPLIKKTFGGVTSPADEVWNKCLLDAKVINAEDGYLYSLGFYANGSTALGAENSENWAIYKRPKDYSSESYIVTTTLKQEALVRGGVQTISLVSSGSELFLLTINTDVLPPRGTFIKNNSTSSKAYSWAINPSNYIPRAYANNDTTVSSGRAYIKYIASLGYISYRFKSNGKNMETAWGKNGANLLPNFRSIATSSDNKELSDSTFTIVQSTSTDWLPPLVFYADSGDSGATKTEFTGGNHLVGGANTAVNTLYQIFIDGRLLDMTKDFSGYVNDMSIFISNDVYASNTVSSKKAVIRQSFAIDFSGEEIAVSCENIALEALHLTTDYGAQMTSTGYQETQLFVGGAQLTRNAFDNSANSGNSSEYSDAFAIALKSSAGTLMSYMDINYGVYNQENILSNQPRIKGGGGTNNKFYHAAWFTSGGIESQHLRLLAGDSYKWRGGYIMQAPLSLASYDTVAKIGNESIFIKNGQDYMIF